MFIFGKAKIVSKKNEINTLLLLKKLKTMKFTKSIMMVLGLLLGLVTLMSSQCNSTDDPPNPECTGYAQASSSGYITDAYCFEQLVNFEYAENEYVRFSANATDGDVTYTLWVNINPFSGTKSYTCGLDNPGYVELTIHGTDNEFYKSQSGTISVTQVDATHFVATINVELKGYYNEESVTLQGTVSMGS